MAFHHHASASLHLPIARRVVPMFDIASTCATTSLVPNSIVSFRERTHVVRIVAQQAIVVEEAAL